MKFNKYSNLTLHFTNISEDIIKLNITGISMDGFINTISIDKKYYFVKGEVIARRLYLKQKNIFKSLRDMYSKPLSSVEYKQLSFTVSNNISLSLKDMTIIRSILLNMGLRLPKDLKAEDAIGNKFNFYIKQNLKPFIKD